MSLADDWHPIALSASVDPGTCTGAHLLGSELALWRGEAGAIHVWEDRCPHRGMRLSFGFVRGDRITCIYHGWRFGGEGRCAYIPAHPDLAVPDTITANTYVAAEHHGMIWTSLNRDAVHPLLFDGDASVLPLRSLYLDCDAEQVLAALQLETLDPFKKGRDGPTEIKRVADRLYRLSNSADTLLFGIQTPLAGKTALHIAISGTQEIYAGSGQLHFLHWAQGMRYRLRRLRPDPGGSHVPRNIL